MKRRILSCMMILSIAFSLIGVLPVAAADVTYEVTGGMIYFDAATGTVTLPEGIDGEFDFGGRRVALVPGANRI